MYIPWIYRYRSGKLGKKITRVCSWMWKHCIPTWRDREKMFFSTILVAFTPTATTSQPFKIPIYKSTN